ncbi:MAG: WXG100 family type VII secretion target [Pseudonocardiaceae bacterium]
MCAASGRMLVTFDAIETGASNIDAVADQIDQQLDDLKSYIAPLVASWTGQAFTDYQALEQKWDTSAAELSQVLRQIAATLRTDRHLDRLREDVDPEVVVAARRLRAGRLALAEWNAVFRTATVYAQAPSRPGFMVADLPGKGSWVSVFSSLDRLGAFVGECDWMSMPGWDLIDLLPEGVGAVLDPDSEHAVAIPPRNPTTASNTAGPGRAGTSDG